MKELVTALQPVLEKLAGVFRVFDLSFFLPGAAALLAGFTLVHRMGWEQPPSPGEWQGAFVVIVAAYLLGLLVFTAGRTLRRTAAPPWKPTGDASIQTAMEATLQHNGLDETTFPGFWGGGALTAAAAHRLNTRLWTELRHDSGAAASYELLYGAWVRIAVYDGVLATSLLWCAVFAVLGFEDPRAWPVANGVACALSVGVCALCWHEANRAERLLVSDLVSVIALRRQTPPAPTEDAPANPAATP